MLAKSRSDAYGEGSRKQGNNTGALTRLGSSATNSQEPSVINCRHCGPNFTAADASFVFRVRHQDAAGCGHCAGALCVAHVAIEQWKHAD
jgi:hypothetical protein